MVSSNQIEAFIAGNSLAADVVAEIDSALDDPNTEVSIICREKARITQLMFDPDGPLLGEGLGQK
jgi:hypothetical protein